LEAGARKAKFQPLNSSELIHSAHQVYEAVAEESSQTLHVDAALPEMLSVLGDKGLL